MEKIKSWLFAFVGSVRPGQVWLYKLGGRDPFKASREIRYEILAVKDEYVQYQNIDTGEIDSTPIRWFKIGARLSRKDAIE